jgi:methylisocitrate lyase
MKLKELLAAHQLLVPCVYDCMSARAAKEAGFASVLLSGGGLSYSLLGLPDLAMLTLDDLVQATERISACVDLPLVVDADDGYGESPAVVYHAVKRLVRAGAQAITIDDSTGIRGYERYIYSAQHPGSEKYYQHVVARSLWLAKIAAAVAACQGSDCFIVARTEAYTQYGFDEMIARCRSARALGAEMTLICDGMENTADAEIVSKRIPGWKMWPDYYSVSGQPNASMDNLCRMGFNMVTCHIFEKAALYGMLRAAENTAEWSRQTTAGQGEHL